MLPCAQVPQWVAFRERLPATPRGLRSGDSRLDVAARNLLLPLPPLLAALLLYSILWGCAHSQIHDWLCNALWPWRLMSEPSPQQAFYIKIGVVADPLGISQVSASRLLAQEAARRCTNECQLSGLKSRTK